MPRPGLALVHVRRFLPLRLAVVVALLLAGVALGRPAAAPEGVAALAAAQAPGAVTWSWGTVSPSGRQVYQVGGVMPLTLAGSTQTWTFAIEPSYGWAFSGAFPLEGITWSGPAQYCSLIGSDLGCVNGGSTTVSVSINVTLPQSPGVYEVDVQVTRPPIGDFSQANIFLVATAATPAQCPGGQSAAGHTVIRQGAGGSGVRC